MNQSSSCGVEISCSKCGLSDDMSAWVDEMPTGAFQCPGCGFAFKRQNEGPYTLLHNPDGSVRARVPARIVLVQIRTRKRKERAA